jgi:Flp pilus assembly pilin Flp
MQLNKRKAQGMLEYALLIAIFVAVIVALQIYVKRGLQGKFKQTADQIGEQFTTGQSYTIQRISQSATKEETKPDTDIGGWTKSTIQDSTFVSGTKAGDYPGYEVTKSDYVSATTGAGALGSHSTFDSGKLSEITLFDDD